MPASAAAESMFEGESATPMEAVDGNGSVLVTHVPKPRVGSFAAKNKPHSHRTGVRQKEVSSRYGVNTPTNTASPPLTPVRAHAFAAARNSKHAEDMCATPSDSSPSSASSSSSSSSSSASSIDGDDVGILDRMLSLDRLPRDPDAPFATASDLDASPGCGTLLDLPRELLVLCLTYLRPWDLSALALTAQHFNDYAIFQQVAEPLLEKYGGAPAGSVDRGLGALLEGLRFQEGQHVHKLLSAPEPLPGQSGYWLSKSWATNHRRFAELMATKRKGALNGGNGKGRRSSLRERRESDVMPPWPDVNADITCEHGNLRPLNGSKNSSASFICKRRAVDKRTWRVLRRLYPEAKAFKTSVDECGVCSAKDREEKDRVEEAKRVREAERTSSPALERLFNRRTGSPTAHGLAPLDPGLYHVVPRCWLSQWRNYIRDPRVVRPRDPECALVLCEAHGLPLIPPHVMDFLTGVSHGRGLLSNLTSRSGVVCEILNPEEWDALGKVYKTDFCLTFSLDPEDLSVSWSTAPCTRCDPAGYDESQITVRNRQRSWAL